MGDAIAAIFRNQPNTDRLVSKKQRFFQTWPLNAEEVDVEEDAAPGSSLTKVWNRDTVAAKLIMYKGLY